MLSIVISRLCYVRDPLKNQRRLIVVSPAEAVADQATLDSLNKPGFAHLIYHDRCDKDSLRLQ